VCTFAHFLDSSHPQHGRKNEIGARPRMACSIGDIAFVGDTEFVENFRTIIDPSVAKDRSRIGLASCA